MKFDNIEDLREKKKEIINNYKGEVPSYILDYFDEKEKNFLETERIQSIRAEKYDFEGTREEYSKKRIEEYWANNDNLIVKKEKRVGFSDCEAVWEDPPRNEERAEQERDLTEEEVRALIKLCEDDIYLFAVRYFPHYLKKPSSRLHKYIYEFINRMYKPVNRGVSRRKPYKKAIAAPRGCAKSSLVSAIFPIWCTVYNKKRFILLISDTAGQAEDFLADIKREFEANELLKRDFPHATGTGKTWRLDKIITSNDVQILALGTGNKVRGRRFGIYRPDLVCGDDLENSEDVKSESRRKFIRYEWFNKDLMFVGGEEGNTTDFFIVGTILGKESLLNNLLNPEEYPDWNGIKFQAIEKFHDPSADPYWEEWERLYRDVFDVNRKETALKFFEEHKEIMLKGTQVLWPEGSSYYENYCVKVSDLSGFYSERQNDPKDPSKILVTEDQIHKRNFKTDARIQKILFDRRTKWFGALDPSLGKKADVGDYSCIVTVCVDFETGNILVPDIDMKRRPVDNQILAILKHHIDFKYKLFGVETNMFQLVIADNLRKISKRENIYVPIEEVTNYYDKKARIESIVPLLKDGTVIFDSYAMRYNQSYKIAMDQLTSFTGIGDEHDDFPDCLEIAISIAKAKKFKPLYRVNKK